MIPVRLAKITERNEVLYFVCLEPNTQERERERHEKCFTEESKDVFFFLLFDIKATHKASTLTHKLFWHTTTVTYA